MCARSALGLGLWCPQFDGNDIAGAPVLLSLLVEWLCVSDGRLAGGGGRDPEPGGGSSGRIEPAVDGRDDIVVALRPGVEAEVGSVRGVRL